MAISNKTAKKVKKGIGPRVRSEEDDIAEVKRKMKKYPILPHSRPRPATIKPKTR